MFLVWIVVAVLLIASIIWFSRYQHRALKSRTEELASLPTLNINQLAAIIDGREDDGEIAEMVFQLSGKVSGIRKMERKSRCLVRVLGSTVGDYGQRISNEELADLQELAFQIRIELVLAICECAANRLIPISRLHSVRAVKLYCKLVGTMEEIASFNASPELLILAAQM
jgi:hypothetical protein